MQRRACTCTFSNERRVNAGRIVTGCRLDSGITVVEVDVSIDVLWMKSGEVADHLRRVIPRRKWTWMARTIPLAIYSFGEECQTT